MTEQTADASRQTGNVRIVEDFLNALRDQHFDLAEPLMDDDLVYENVGFPTLRGRPRTMKMWRRMQGHYGFDVKIHRAAADGVSVLTERTDVLIVGPVRLKFWVCGIFEVHDGRITLWRDYFDVFDVLKATGRGLIGAVVPALRPHL